MDTEPKAEVRAPQGQISEVGSAKDGRQRVNRWLVFAVAALSVAVIALGAALIVESGSEGAAPTPPVVVEPTAEPGTGSTTDGVPLLAGFEVADRDPLAPQELVRHVDGGIRAYQNGDQEHFECGGYGCGGSVGTLYYSYDEAAGWRNSGDVFSVVDNPNVERTSPVVLLRGTPASGSWTVAFSVQAGSDEQLWIQHWEEPWGEWLQEMWVI
jgi:hypothetical protein